MNQHFVPRVYLKNFSVEKKGEYYIDVFNKIDKSEFTTNIKNICGENDLYTLPPDSKVATNPLAVENVYGCFLEPSFQRAYEILTNDKLTSINIEERTIILVSILQFYLRNPLIIRNNIDSHSESIKNIYNNAIDSKLSNFNYLGIDFPVNLSLDEIIVKF